MLSICQSSGEAKCTFAHNTVRNLNLQSLLLLGKLLDLPVLHVFYAHLCSEIRTNASFPVSLPFQRSLRIPHLLSFAGEYQEKCREDATMPTKMSLPVASQSQNGF